MHTLVCPLPRRAVQLGWTCQECETPTDIALGISEARKPSHHFKVHAPGDGASAMFGLISVPVSWHHCDTVFLLILDSGDYCVGAICCLVDAPVVGKFKRPA